MQLANHSICNMAPPSEDEKLSLEGLEIVKFMSHWLVKNKKGTRKSSWGLVVSIPVMNRNLVYWFELIHTLLEWLKGFLSIKQQHGCLKFSGSAKVWWFDPRIWWQLTSSMKTWQSRWFILLDLPSTSFLSFWSNFPHGHWGFSFFFCRKLSSLARMVGGYHRILLLLWFTPRDLCCRTHLRGTFEGGPCYWSFLPRRLRCRRRFSGS